MSINANGLRTTIYKVDDLAAAKKWYADAFGTLPYFDEPFYVGFNIGGYELGLLPEKVEGVRTENVLSYWAVHDITDAYDKMVSHGAKELEAPNDVGGGIKVALVKDPWQNVVGLIYNPYFKEALPVKTIVEWAAFRLANHASEAELLKASAVLEKEFLLWQDGFIKRELLRKSNKEWVDLIFWEDKASAEAAFEKAAKNEAAGAYFQLMMPTNPEEESPELKGSEEKSPGVSYYEVAGHL